MIINYAFTWYAYDANMLRQKCMLNLSGNVFAAAGDLSKDEPETNCHVWGEKDKMPRRLMELLGELNIMWKWKIAAVDVMQ